MARFGFARGIQQAFEQIKGHIKNGDIYQVNYSYRLRCSSLAAPMAFLRLLKDQNPPFGATLTADNFSIHSASPELFFRLEGNLIESRPMKGTAARGLTLEEDCREAAALQSSEKNRAENLMIVDMVRNDLGRIAETGSVKVSNLFALEKYPTYRAADLNGQCANKGIGCGYFQGHVSCRLHYRCTEKPGHANHR